MAGNKSDLVTQVEVTEDEAAEYAKENDIIFREVSAKNNSGIEELMKDIGLKMFNSIDINSSIDQGRIVLDTTGGLAKKEVKKKGCCGGGKKNTKAEI